MDHPPEGHKVLFCAVAHPSDDAARQDARDGAGVKGPEHPGRELEVL